MEAEAKQNKAKELFLDTKGSCFLCLKESETSDGTTNPTTMREVSVRNICKYLSINSSLVLLKSLKDRELTNEELKEASAQRNKCDFSVLLCSTCSTLSTQLTKLIRELEMTKMMINLRLQQFQKILSTSELKVEDGQDDQPRWEKLKGKMMTSENPVEARLVETLRNTAKEKCSTRLKQLKESSNPKVTLKRLQITPKMVEPQLLPPPPPPIDVASSENGSVETPSTSTLNARKIDGINKQKIIDFCATQFQLVASDGSRYECKICNDMYSKDNTFYHPHHIIMRHPEKIFLHQTLQNLGKEKLLELVPSVLFAEAKNSVRNQCVVCGWGCSRRYGLKYHLVLEHFSYVENQLLNAVNLQQNKTPFSPFIPNSGAPNKCNTETKTCQKRKRSIEPPKNFHHPLPFVCDVRNGGSGCGKRFKMKFSLSQHKRTCNKVQICNVAYGGCGNTFKDLFALRLHKCPKGPSKSTSPRKFVTFQQPNPSTNLDSHFIITGGDQSNYQWGEMEIDSQEVFGGEGEPSLEYEVEIVEENEEKPVIAEEILCEIDMSDFSTAMDEDVHSDFHGTMAGLNGLKNEQQLNDINIDIKPGYTEQAILLPDL